MKMAEIIITDKNFEAEIMQSDRPVLLDFWATWCGPCRMLAPEVAEIAEEHPEIKVGKVNVDEEPALANAFQISSIPTLVVMKGGRPVKTSVGFIPKADIESLLD